MKVKAINDISLMNGFCDFVFFKKDEICEHRVDAYGSKMVYKYNGYITIPDRLFKENFVVIEE